MRAGAWGGILGVATAVRALVAFGLLRSMPLVSDAASYAEFAQELLRDFPGHDAYYWPPGNSFLLALGFAPFGPSVAVARLVMLALGVASVALVVLVARQLANDRVATVAGYMAALYPPAVLLAPQSYAQHLAGLTLLAAAYFGLRAVREQRAWLYALAAVAFGVGCLTRPSMVSVAPFLGAAWLLRLRNERKGAARAVAGALVFAAVSAAIVVPVQIHNLRCGGGFTISTNNERNFFLGNNPYTPHYKTSHLGQRPLDELDPDTQRYLRTFYDRQDARQAMQAEAIRYIAHHPLITAYRTLNRATAFWGFDYLGSRIIQEHAGWGKKGLLPLLALEAGGYMLVMALAIVGFFAFREDSDPFFRRWLVLLALAYELPYMVAFSGGTYHFPVMGLLIPLAALPLAHGGPGVWLERLRGQRWAWVALAAFFVIQLQYAYYTMAMSGSA